MQEIKFSFYISNGAAYEWLQVMSKWNYAKYSQYKWFKCVQITYRATKFDFKSENTTSSKKIRSSLPSFFKISSSFQMPLYALHHQYRLSNILPCWFGNSFIKSNFVAGKLCHILIVSIHVSSLVIWLLFVPREESSKDGLVRWACSDWLLTKKGDKKKFLDREHPDSKCLSWCGSLLYRNVGVDILQTKVFS